MIGGLNLVGGLNPVVPMEEGPGLTTVEDIGQLRRVGSSSSTGTKIRCCGFDNDRRRVSFRSISIICTPVEQFILTASSINKVT